MKEQAKVNTDIDYEHMDDLPLSAHIEWKNFQIEEVITNDLYDFQDEWQSA